MSRSLRNQTPELGGLPFPKPLKDAGQIHSLLSAFYSTGFGLDRAMSKAGIRV